MTDVRRSWHPPNGYTAAAAGTALLALIGLALCLSTNPAGAVTGHVYEDTVTALVWSGLAGLLATRAPDHPVVPMFLTVAAAAAVAVAAGALALDETSAAAVPAAWLSSWIWSISTFIPVTLLVVTFPEGRWRKHPVVATTTLIGIAVMSFGLATSKTISLTDHHDVPNQLASPLSDGAFFAGSILVVVCAVASVVVLLRRLRSASGLLRQQLAPVAVAAPLTVVALIAAAVWSAGGPYVQLIATPVLPGAVVVMILQYRLYEIEVVVRRSLVFFGLTALVIGGYLLIVQATANLLRHQPGVPESLIAAAGVSLVFQPARSAMQRLVGRWVYGDRSTPHQALVGLLRQLSAAADPQVAVQTAVEGLRTSFRVPWVEVASDDTIIALAGARPSWAHDEVLASVDLVHLGTGHGRIRIAPRTPHEALTARDRTLLAQLAEPIAAVVATQNLILDLHRSRERVVIAREDERRRLRRDLHDGLGPLLSALGNHADVARLRMSRNDASVPDVLDRIRSLSSSAIADLRTVIDDLHPVAIDELGLMGAIRELTATMSVDDRTVVADGGAAPAPAAVELAIYRIVAEATSNAIRHGDARNVRVTITDSGTEIAVDIVNDGDRLGNTATGGVGLASMRERAEELGGTFEIAGTEHGTRVHATFPRRAQP